MLRLLATVVLGASSIVSVTALPVGAEGPNPDPVEPDPLSILGPTRMSAEGLVTSYEAVGHEPRLTVPLTELAQIFVEEGERYGVRADIAWAQSIVETGWFRYPANGQVRVADNNFAGIGAYDGGVRGFQYPDARAGVRAQIQLLAQYADGDALDSFPDEPLVKAPAFVRGSVSTWREMGNGKWASSTRYSESVLRIYAEMVEEAGFANEEPDVPVPVARPGDGLWLAGADGHVYDVGDARFWGSAGGRVKNTAVVDIAVTPGAEGYWMVTYDGYVGAYGEATRWGDVAGQSLAPTVDIASDPSGSGYWTLSAAGEVHAFGSAARIEPAPGALPSGTTFVAMIAMADGDGYWMVDNVGNVVGVGSAPFYGSAVGFVDPDDPVVDMAPRPFGDGYWLVTRSGEVHAFGAAEDFGSLADDWHDESQPPPLRTVVGIRSAVSGLGYWIVSSDGYVAGLGDAVDFDPVKLRGAPVLGLAGLMDVAATRLATPVPAEPDE